MQTYPNLRAGLVASLLTLRRDFDGDNTILDSANCPYDSEQIDQLKQLFRISAAPLANDVIPEKAAIGRPRGEAALAKLTAERREIASEELEKVKTELQQLRDDARSMKDVGDKIQIIKVAVALVEKIVVLEERAFGIKRNAQFQNVVLSVLDDLMPIDARGEFMKRVADFASAE